MKSLLLLLTITFCANQYVFTQSQTGVELEAERTAFSKTFLKPNGSKELVTSAGYIHYQQNGAWLPIETALVPMKTGFSNETNVFKSKFPDVLQEGSFIELEVNNEVIYLDATKKLIAYNEVTGLESLPSIAVSAGGNATNNVVNYPHIFAGMSDRYTVMNGALKNDFQLDEYPALLDAVTDGYFGFQERFVLPENWRIEAEGISYGQIITTDLKIIDANDQHVLSIPAPVFYDENDHSNDGTSSVQGGFVIDLTNNGWLVSTLVPVDWLKSPNRSYPVVLDPSVTIAGTEGGWMSVVTLVNNSSFVFIGVCCGNQEHRAWLKFNTTSIPDNACVTNVELQVYVNGVGTAITELVHAYDMTGSFGPYAAVDPAVLADMANGYYTSFNLSGVGTYGWYDLGPSADALLQAQLPGNWYQVALIFDNEPSVNWKRLTATSCNIRVAYDDPPCLPLPVGLTSFDLACEDDRAKLEWHTATENNSDYFTIWRSTDGKAFEELAKVKASGNSSTEKIYEWIDVRASEEEVYYQLSQTDFDGTTNYYESKIYEACAEENPVVYIDGEGNIRISANKITAIEIRDNMGRTLLKENADQTHEWMLSNPGFTAGYYTADIIYANGKRKAVPFLFAK